MRTNDMYSSYPEELNHNLTGKLATLHFVPTQLNVDNLAKESITANVFLTGNTVIDAVLSIARPDYVFEDLSLKKICFDGMRTILMTAHRRENLGAPMMSSFEAVLEIVNKNEIFQVKSRGAYCRGWSKGSHCTWRVCKTHAAPCCLFRRFKLMPAIQQTP